MGDLSPELIGELAAGAVVVGAGVVGAVAKIFATREKQPPVQEAKPLPDVALGRMLDRTGDAYEQLLTELRESRQECREENEKCQRRNEALEARVETLERMLPAPR